MTSAREIAPGVHRFGDGRVNWYVLADKGALTVVDGGLPSHWSQFVAWLDASPYSLSDVRAVVLTHGHPDHLGVAERLRRQAGAIVYVHVADRAAARGHGLCRPSHRLIRSIWAPHDLEVLQTWLRAGIGRVPPIAEATAFGDGDLLDVPGGLRVVHAPGHTPGSCTLVTADGAVAFTGDTLVTLDVVTGRQGIGTMVDARAGDPEQALRSLEYTLSGIRAATVLPGHGPPCTDGLPGALAHASHAAFRLPGP